MTKQIWSKYDKKRTEDLFNYLRPGKEYSDLLALQPGIGRLENMYCCNICHCYKLKGNKEIVFLFFCE